MAPTANDVLDSVREMASLVQERAGEVEAARRLPADLVQDLRDAGVFGLWIPTELGGPEVDPITATRVIEELSCADGSVGWCSMLALCTSAFSAYVEREAAAEIFRPGDPAITGGVFATRGTAIAERDGYRVSGRWPFASGCDHCDWLCVGCAIDRESARDPGDDAAARLAFLPASEIEIIDTWHALGLRGTGSSDVMVEGAFVPSARTIRFDQRSWASGPLWRIPFPCLVAGPVAAVSLGIGRDALDAVARFVEADTREYALGGWQWWVLERTRRVLSDRDVVQSQMAQREAALRSARALVFETLGHVWSDVNAGLEVTPKRQLLLRLAALQASRCAIEAVDTAFSIGGASAIYDNSTLQRAFRDAHTVGQHILVASSGFEVVGRELFHGAQIAPA